MLVYRRIQHAPRNIVAFISGQQQVAAQAVREFLYRGFLERYLCTIAGHRANVATYLRERLQCRHGLGRRKCCSNARRQ